MPEICPEYSVAPERSPPHRFVIGTRPAAGLGRALQSVLTQALGIPCGQTITLAVTYVVALTVPPAGPKEAPVTRLPVALCPNFAFSATTAADLEYMLERWLQSNQPTAGEWEVSLSFYPDAREIG